MILQLKLKLNKTQYPEKIEITKFLDMIKNRGHEIVEVKQNNKIDKEYKKHLNL